MSITCAALPPGIIESELFGHVRGSFTGATADRVGRFQMADGGTLLLDEVGESPPALQTNLLRVLETGSIESVGSDRTRTVDVRILAATNRDLHHATRSERFREDLYYRLAVFPIHVPPLRARREDIAVISNGFLESLHRRTGRGPWRLSDRAMEWLRVQAWRGNVRELVNVLERATILARGPVLDVDGFSPSAPIPHTEVEAHEPSSLPPLTLAEAQRRHIALALQHTAGKLYGPGGAAEILGIPASTLRSRMQKLGLGGARDFRDRRRRSAN